MGCVDELCAGLADLARPVHIGTVLVRVRPRPLKTQFYRRPAVQWSCRSYAGASRRRYDDPKNEKMENRNTFSGRNTSSVWVPTMPEPHRDLLRSPYVVWRPREEFRPIWGVLSDDEDTSGSLPEFIDAANDVQSTGTTLEDGAAPGYCDVGSPDTAGGDLGCSDDSGSNTSPSLIRAQLRRPSAM